MRVGLLSSRTSRLTASAFLSLLIIFCQPWSTNAGAGNGIEESPSWRVALFLMLFLLISTGLEIFFHKVEHMCAHKGLYGHLHAIEKIKEELMLLGFISLILLAAEDKIANICISNDFWKGVKCPGHVIITSSTPKNPEYYKNGWYGPASGPAPVPAPAPTGGSYATAYATFDGTEGVTGTITFDKKDSDSNYVYMTVDLKGLQSLAGGYHIHQYKIGSGNDACSVTGGHWNPKDVVYSAGNSCNVNEAIDSCEVGDLSGKYGGLGGKEYKKSVEYEYKDSQLKLYGEYSIVGRSIVIHKADPDSTRWVCADIKAKSGTAAKAYNYNGRRLLYGAAPEMESDTGEGYSSSAMGRLHSNATVHGLRKRRSGRRRVAAGAEDPTCDAGQSAFIEIAAMHQIHILIFLIAVSHIFFTMVALELARLKVRTWTAWEFWGDDANETAEALRPPKKQAGEPFEFFRNLFNMFFKTVDPFGYIACRRFYISKNNKPDDFEYEVLVLRSLQNDFKNVVGVSSWMWLIVMFQVFAEGYHFGKYYITLIVSCTMIVAVGTKMMYVYNYIVRGVLKVYDEESDGKISQEDLDRIQKSSQDTDALKKIEPVFWTFRGKGGTHLILQVIRFALFTASVVVAEAIFYAWQVKTDACYFDDRAFGGSVMPHERRLLAAAEKTAYRCDEYKCAKYVDDISCHDPLTYTYNAASAAAPSIGRRAAEKCLQVGECLLRSTECSKFVEIHQDETPWVVVIMACVAVLLIVLLGLVTIPAYVVLNTSSHHQQNQAILHARLHTAFKMHAASHTTHNADKEVKRARSPNPTVQVEH